MKKEDLDEAIGLVARAVGWVEKQLRPSARPASRRRLKHLYSPSLEQLKKWPACRVCRRLGLRMMRETLVQNDQVFDGFICVLCLRQAQDQGYHFGAATREFISVYQSKPLVTAIAASDLVVSGKPAFQAPRPLLTYGEIGRKVTTQFQLAYQDRDNWWMGHVEDHEYGPRYRCRNRPPRHREPLAAADLNGSIYKSDQGVLDGPLTLPTARH